MRAQSLGMLQSGNAVIRPAVQPRTVNAARPTIAQPQLPCPISPTSGRGGAMA
jgi:hypothetical protein